MSSNGEIIHLHVGQAGVQIANACWELYCLEHGIDMAGCMYECPRDESFKTFFAFSSTPKVVPRLVMVDSEPTVIDEVRTGTYGHLFKPETLITGKEDSGSNFARGFLTLSTELVEPTMESLRTVAEGCCNLKGFLVFRSIGGGTGSGLGDSLMEHIMDEYGKLTKLDFIIFPSPSMSPLIVEPYNSVLSTHIGMDSNDCTFILDNEALYDICESKLEVRNPTYTNLNRIIGQAISGLTASMRFEGSTNVSLTEFQTNLVPYPRIRFPLVSYSPLVTMYSSCYTELSTEQLTYESFQSSNQLVRCNPAEGKYMSCVLLYRGNIAPADINTSIQHLREKGAFRFVDWSPTGFKIGINSMPPYPVPGGDVGATDRAVMALSNNSVIQRAWCRLLSKFDNLFQRRAFIHHFISEGLEEDMFTEASEDICSLIEDYFEVESNIPNKPTRKDKKGHGKSKGDHGTDHSNSSDTDSSRDRKKQDLTVQCCCECHIPQEGKVDRTQGTPRVLSRGDFNEEHGESNYKRKNIDCSSNEKPLTKTDTVSRVLSLMTEKCHDNPNENLFKPQQNIIVAHSKLPLATNYQKSDAISNPSENTADVPCCSNKPPSTCDTTETSRCTAKTSLKPLDVCYKDISTSSESNLDAQQTNAWIQSNSGNTNSVAPAYLQPPNHFKSEKISRSQTELNIRSENCYRPRLPLRFKSSHKISDTDNSVRSLTSSHPSTADGRDKTDFSADHVLLNPLILSTLSTTEDTDSKGSASHTAFKSTNIEDNDSSQLLKPATLLRSPTEPNIRNISSDEAGLPSRIESSQRATYDLHDYRDISTSSESNLWGQQTTDWMQTNSENTNSVTWIHLRSPNYFEARAPPKPVKSAPIPRSQTEFNIRKNIQNSNKPEQLLMTSHKVADNHNRVQEIISRSLAFNSSPSVEGEKSKTPYNGGRALLKRPKSPQTEHPNKDIHSKGTVSHVMGKNAYEVMNNEDHDRASSKPLKSATVSRSQTELNIRNKNVPPRAMSSGNRPSENSSVNSSRSLAPRPPSSAEESRQHFSTQKSCKTPPNDGGRASLKPQRSQTKDSDEDIHPKQSTSRVVVRDTQKINNNGDRASSKPAVLPRSKTEYNIRNKNSNGPGSNPRAMSSDGRASEKSSRSLAPRPPSSAEESMQNSSTQKSYKTPPYDGGRTSLKPQRSQTKDSDKDIRPKRSASRVMLRDTQKINNNGDRASSKPAVLLRSKTEYNIRNKNSNGPGSTPRAISSGGRTSENSSRSLTPHPPSSTEESRQNFSTQKSYKTPPYDGGRTSLKPQRSQTKDSDKDIRPKRSASRVMLRDTQKINNNGDRASSKPAVLLRSKTEYNIRNKNSNGPGSTPRAISSGGRTSENSSRSLTPHPPSSTEESRQNFSTQKSYKTPPYDGGRTSLKPRRSQTKDSDEDTPLKRSASRPAVRDNQKINNNGDRGSSKPAALRRSKTEYNIRNKNSSELGPPPRAMISHKVVYSGNRVSENSSRSLATRPPSSTEECRQDVSTKKSLKTPYDGGCASQKLLKSPTPQPSQTGHTHDDIHPKRSVSRVVVKDTHKVINKEKREELNNRNKTYLPSTTKSSQKVLTATNHVTERSAEKEINRFIMEAARSKQNPPLKGSLKTASIGTPQGVQTDRSKRSTSSSASKSSHMISNYGDRSQTQLNIRNTKSVGTDLRPKVRSFHKIADANDLITRRSSTSVTRQPVLAKPKQRVIRPENNRQNLSSKDSRKTINNEGHVSWKSPRFQPSETYRSEGSILHQEDCSSPKPLKSETLRRSINFDEAGLPRGARISHIIDNSDDHDLQKSPRSLNLHRCQAELNLPNMNSDMIRLYTSLTSSYKSSNNFGCASLKSPTVHYFQIDQSEEAVPSSSRKQLQLPSRYSQTEVSIQDINPRRPEQSSNSHATHDSDDSDSAKSSPHSSGEGFKTQTISIRPKVRIRANISNSSSHKKRLADRGRIPETNSELKANYPIEDYRLQHLYNEDGQVWPRFKVYPKMSNKKHCSTQTIPQVESSEYALNRSSGINCQNASFRTDPTSSMLESSTIINVTNLNVVESDNVNATTERSQTIDSREGGSSRRPRRSLTPYPFQKERSFRDRPYKRPSLVAKSNGSNKNDSIQSTQTGVNMNKESEQLSRSQSYNKADSHEDHASRPCLNVNGSGISISRKRSSHKNVIEDNCTSIKPSGSLACDHTEENLNLAEVSPEGEELIPSSKSYVRIEDSSDLQIHLKTPKSSQIRTGCKHASTPLSPPLRTYFSQTEPGLLDINSEERLCKSKSYQIIDSCEDIELFAHLESPITLNINEPETLPVEMGQIVHGTQSDPDRTTTNSEGRNLDTGINICKKIDGDGNAELDLRTLDRIKSKLLVPFSKATSFQLPSAKFRHTLTPYTSCIPDLRPNLIGLDPIKFRSRSSHNITSGWGQVDLNSEHNKSDETELPSDDGTRAECSTSAINSDVNPGSSLSHNIMNSGYSASKNQLGLPIQCSCKELNRQGIHSKEQHPGTGCVHKSANCSELSAESSLSRFSNSGCNVSSKRLELPSQCCRIELSIHNIHSKEYDRSLCAECSNKSVTNSKCSCEVNPESSLPHNTTNSVCSVSQKQLELPSHCCRIVLSIQDIHSNREQHSASGDPPDKSANDSASEVNPGSNHSHDTTNAGSNAPPKDERPSSGECPHKSNNDSEVIPGSSHSHDTTSSGSNVPLKPLTTQCSQIDSSIQNTNSNGDERPSNAKKASKSAYDSECSSEVNLGSSLSHNITNSGSNISTTQCYQIDSSIQDTNCKRNEPPSSTGSIQKSAYDSKCSFEVNPGSSHTNSITNSGSNVSTKELTLPTQCCQIGSSIQDTISNGDEGADYFLKSSFDSAANSGSDFSHNITNSRCSVSPNTLILRFPSLQIPQSNRDTNSNEDEVSSTAECSHKSANSSKYSSTKSSRYIRSPNQIYSRNNISYPQMKAHESQSSVPKARVSEIGILREHIALRRHLNMMTRIPPSKQLFMHKDSRIQESQKKLLSRWTDQHQGNTGDVDNGREDLSRKSVDSEIVPKQMKFSLKSTKLRRRISKTNTRKNEVLPIMSPGRTNKTPEIPPLNLQSVSSQDSLY